MRAEGDDGRERRNFSQPLDQLIARPVLIPVINDIKAIVTTARFLDGLSYRVGRVGFVAPLAEHELNDGADVGHRLYAEDAPFDRWHGGSLPKSGLAR